MEIEISSTTYLPHLVNIVKERPLSHIFVSWIGQEWQISALCQQEVPHWAAVTMGKTSNNADNYIGAPLCMHLQSCRY